MASPLRMSKKNTASFVAGTVIEGGTGFGLGLLRGKFRNSKVAQKSHVIAAVAGKGGWILAHLFGRGAAAHAAGELADSVGAGGLALVGAEMGIKLGQKMAGLKTHVVPVATALPPSAYEVTMGALPPAPAGETLTWDQLMQFREMR